MPDLPPGQGADQVTSRMTHALWQADVVKLATLSGWHHHHVRKSIGRRNGKAAHQTTTNRPGWPDLLLYAPGRGIIAVELKVWPDKPTPEQLEVLADLAAAGARTFVWYPADLDEATQVLARRPARRTA